MTREKAQRSVNRHVLQLIGRADYLERLAEVRGQPHFAAKHHAIRLSLLDLAMRQAGVADG